MNKLSIMAAIMPRSHAMKSLKALQTHSSISSYRTAAKSVIVTITVIIVFVAVMQCFQWFHCVLIAALRGQSLPWKKFGADFLSGFRIKHLFITTCIEKHCTRPSNGIAQPQKVYGATSSKIWFTSFY